MQNNICPECKTENEPEYQFCKNCGAPVFSAPSSPPQSEDDNSTAQPVGGILIDGNPIDKVYTFVGKNAPKIVPKFIKINETGSKTEWCWPPFILGFFLGPVGVAVWFLYRKMYKPACLFGAIAVVLNYITEAVDFFFGSAGSAKEMLKEYFYSFATSGTFDTNRFLSLITDRNMIINSMVSSVESIVTLACAIVSGLFGIYLYKNHTAKKIKSYAPISNDPNYIKIGLSSLGGTSFGSAVLGVIIISVVMNIPNVIFEILKMSGVA